MPSQEPERHLFIFWRWPADRLEATLDKVRQRFDIEHAQFIRWTRERTVENFQRFYAMLSRHAYEKYAEAGTAPFLLLLVTDRSPIYQYRIARGSGFKKVNANTFDLKQILRKQGGTSLHATNDQREFRRDLMLLLGERAADFYPTKWDGDAGSIEEVHRDVVAADGWQSLSQVFAVLNEAVNYVVLRNFDDLPGSYNPKVCGDVDLLLEDADARNRAASILNREQRGTTVVGGQKVAFDFRAVEDFYYDPEWSRRILRDRVMIRGFYAPNPEQHFFSLLYHAHIQKPDSVEIYAPKLLALAQEIGLDWVTPQWVTERDRAAELLANWMKGQGFYLTRPSGWPDYDWDLLARRYGTPVLSHSMPFARRIGHFMHRSPLLRPLVPPILELRRRLRRAGRAKKKNSKWTNGIRRKRLSPR